MEAIQNFIRPELLGLVPVVYFIGVALKKSESIPDKFIPLILGAVSIALALLYILGTTDPKESITFIAVFTSVQQGVLCAGLSVYVNQIIKQSKE